MATTLNAKLAHSFVTMTANMQRLSESERIVALGVLKKTELDIISILQDNPDMTTWRKARYQSLLAQNRETIKTAYAGLAEHHITYLTDVAGISVASTTKIFAQASLPLPSVILTEEQLTAIARNSWVQGQPSSAWWARQSRNLQDSFTQQMQIGYASGETNTQLIQRVRGTATGKRIKYEIDGKTQSLPQFQGGIMDVSTNQAAALVRTSTQQIAADARLLLFKKNDDIIKGVAWAATLDSRTTLLCASRDGRLYTLDGKPIGHRIPFLSGPPAHWNCRSTLIPITKSWDELSDTPGLEQDYLDQIGVGTRASMDGQVPATETFDTWFSGLSEANQVAYLGPKKFEIWKDAGLSMSDMVNQQGNPLSVQQLAAAYGYTPNK